MLTDGLEEVLPEVSGNKTTSIFSWPLKLHRQRVIEGGVDGWEVENLVEHLHKAGGRHYFEV
ncbi:hypothetical protein ACLOJK_026031 [Asimina triloba]